MSLADFHSHLVPGVDDGARTLDDALEGIGRMVDAGYGRLVTTPHLASSATLEPARLARRLNEMEAAWAPVVEAARERWPGLELRRGLEIMIDVPDGDLSDERLCLGGTRFLLLEWPWMQVPPHSGDLLRDIAHRDVRPVVAHPERYRGLDGNMAKVEEWRRVGALIQVNTGSLAGRYGSQVRRRALTLLERGWVDYLGTDFHGRPEYQLHVEAARRVLAERGPDGEAIWERLAATNPGRLLDDEEPEAVPPLPGPRGIVGRLKALFR